MATVAKLMEELPSRFEPETAANLNAVVQFDLTPAGEGGSYYVTIQGGTCTLKDGVHMSPNMTIKMTAADYVALATGGLSHQMAFMTRQLRIHGDLELATKLRHLLALG